MDPSIVRRDVTSVYKRKGEKVVDHEHSRDRGRRERTFVDHFAGTPRATVSKPASTATG